MAPLTWGPLKDSRRFQEASADMALVLTQQELDGLAAECRQATERIPLYDIQARNKVISDTLKRLQDRIIEQVWQRATESHGPVAGDIFVEKL